jgi:hypothetical protein
MSDFKLICVRSRPLTLVLAMVFIAAMPAWAYKTERVCETTEASLKAPAKKVCKTLLVMTEAQKAATAKKEEKKVEKKSGH